MSILKNAFVVGSFTALSRVLGLVREMLQSRLIGAGVAQSAFTLAFALPNMARKLFGEGALTAAFVPVFKAEAETEGLEKAARLARAVMTTVLLSLAAAVALSIAGLCSAQAMAERFAFSERTRLTLSLVTILAPYMLAICGAAFGMGVLNSLGKFKASSLMPSLLNVVWIAALAILSFFPGIAVENRIRLVAGAILAGGFLQMAFMFVAMARRGVSPRPKFSGWFEPKVRLVWRNLATGAAGAGAIQLNYMLDQFLAQAASPWAAGVIGYSERLMDLPLGVVGVAFGTVLLPSLSGLFARNDIEGARDAVSSSLVRLLFLMLPAAAGLAVLAPETAGAIYEGGEFDSLATLRVSRALAVYAVGLGLFGLQKILVPWFQAQRDMKTPLKTTLATVAANAVLNIAAVVLLPVEWRHVGLAASTVLCAGAGCAMLYAAATRKNGSLGLARAAGPVARIAAASIAMGAVLAAAKWAIASSPVASGALPPGSVARLAALVAAGGAVYAACAAAFMRDLLPRRRSVR